MKNLSKFVMAVLTVIVIYVPFCSAHAMGVMTGSTLYSLCTATKSDNVYYQKSATCWAFIEGAREGMNTMFVAEQQLKGSNNPEPLICIPSYVTPIVFQNLFISYYETHPNVQNLPATEIILQANLATYPCNP